MKTTVIYHSADFDGIFCREIARKFLGDEGVEYIGWNFGDAPVPIPDGKIYVLDLPVDRVFGFDFNNLLSVHTWLETNGRGICPEEFIKELNTRLTWIDHHKTSIDSHPTDIPGYRIDGVAACRLAWQWFTRKRPSPPYHLVDAEMAGHLPDMEGFIDRSVDEPYAVRLAGEYDVWDKRDQSAEVFQFGLRSEELQWDLMFNDGAYTSHLLNNGFALQRYQQGRDKSAMNRSFLVKFRGLTFLALVNAGCNSLTFACKDVPETGHDALMGISYNGKEWTISLYHAKHRTDIDLSAIAKTFPNGGGHRGACGFQVKDIVLGSGHLSVNPSETTKTP